MPAPRDTAIIVQAARLYYEQNLSQAEIAAQLDLSRSNVSRILTQARERGIVEVIIHDPDAPPSHDPALEQALAARWPALTQVQVVSSGLAGIDAVARTAAELLAQRARSVRSIGVSWGHTVQSVVAHLPSARLRPAPRVLPLVGGLSALDVTESGDTVLRLLAQKLGAQAEPLYAPAILESAAAGRTLRQESSIARVLEAAAEVDLALVGIGSLGVHSSPHLVELMRLDAGEEAAFRAQGPVADLCGWFLDAAGEPLGPPTADRVVAVTVDQLRAVPDVLAVAAGAEKAPGLASVLRSGAVDTLVVDTELARAVLAR
ncbi:MarR family transcriptional regulator [Brachybacterium sp. EF45031]|uniref:sugar-binding transcriptional regulator n=1 Tax=Brachybacterium sillae TaxID=2810536 RepID=UPI00217D1293|nr:sugar-binding domain-containing protein [Brachybacterium sillae]MCS6711708.1 MarR family transcriptional regulator [Brachybacterium sillae]